MIRIKSDILVKVEVVLYRIGVENRKVCKADFVRSSFLHAYTGFILKSGISRTTKNEPKIDHEHIRINVTIFCFTVDNET